jgi:hypothetical protein
LFNWPPWLSGPIPVPSQGGRHSASPRLLIRAPWCTRHARNQRRSFFLFNALLFNTTKPSSVILMNKTHHATSRKMQIHGDSFD